MEKMKLCAIYNVWDDGDMLRHSIKNMGNIVDGIIVIYSRLSNFGEKETTRHHYLFYAGALSYKHEPDMNLDARSNETAKRNYGLGLARRFGYTHFIMMDADEFYDPEEFNRDKQRLIDKPEIMGLVGRVKCYFKQPTLTIGYDVTLVPMIHKITPELRFEFNRNYPFAWTAINGFPATMEKKIRIDPTRSMNINLNPCREDDTDRILDRSGVAWTETTMHHMSWIRSDIKKKIRNSTARENIEKSTIVQDYVDAKAGGYCQFYRAKLEACENLFNIPDIIDGSLEGIQKSDSSGVNTSPV